MNQKIFITIIIILVGFLLWVNYRINNIENMENCSLNDEAILKNPIFKNIQEIGEKKLIKYLEDFDNNVNDNNHLLIDMAKIENIKKLEKILNSYRVYNPITNIILDDKTNIKAVKNFILKNIILNHLQCFGENDPELFWIRLHLLNKSIPDFKINLKTDTIIEMFNNDTNIYSFDNSKIISFNKHQKNIAKKLIKSHPILKDILTDFTPVYELKLHNIIISLLNYLTSLKKPSQEINKKIRNLYIDLRELILINQIMASNPHLQIGLSNDSETFILDHQVYTKHSNKFKIFLSTFDTFEKLFSSHKISKSKNTIKNIFLNKIRVYLKYNGLKLNDENNYQMLNINSTNLKNLQFPEKLNIMVNPEFIKFLTNKDKTDFSFRIKHNFKMA